MLVIAGAESFLAGVLEGASRVRVSPFVLKAQAVGAAWSAGTINDVAVGGVLIGVSLLGAGATLAFGLRDLVRTAGQRSEQASAESAS